MNSLLRKWTAAIPLVLTIYSAAGSEALPTTRDWNQTASAASAAHNPILIAFTSPYCGYCERLIKEVLVPMSQVPETEQEVLIREVALESAGKMTDFDGLRIRARAFVDRYGVFAVPTIVLVDVDGHPLVDPIVGYSGNADFPPRLKTAIVEAHRKHMGGNAALVAAR